MSEPITSMLDHLMATFERRIRTQAFWSDDDIMLQFGLALGETAAALKTGTIGITRLPVPSALPGCLVE